MLDVSRQGINSAFDNECRRLLGVSGKDFLRLLEADLVQDFDPQDVRYLTDLIVGDPHGTTLPDA